MSEEWQIAIEVGGNDVLLFDGETTLGRSNKADVVLADTSVSRRHALIRVDGGKATIRDLGSSNGTLVGGQEIEGEVELFDGDRIQMGDRLAVLRIRSLLADLEGGASGFGDAEPAVGSATTLLQKASLDLAVKAQAEGREIEGDPGLHHLPTEIRPMPSLDVTELPPEPDGGEALAPEAPRVPDAGRSETSAWGRLLRRVSGWLSRRG